MTARKSLAIVSSYNELCGNAAYTKALKQGLSNHFDVEVISLDVELLRNGDPVLIKKHVNSVCERVRSFDCVNIQFEAGLFGKNFKTIIKNFCRVAESSKNLVVTMHRIDQPKKYLGLFSVYRCGFKKVFSENAMIYRNNRWSNLYSKIVRFCISKTIPIIVHSPKEKKYILTKFSYDCVYDHPLSFYTQDHIEKTRKELSRTLFCNKYNLNSSKKIIGVFGFINNYKDHLTVLKALKVLSDNYHLIICGSQHPHTIREHEKIDGYIESLVHFIAVHKLEKKVTFIRVVSDDDFLSALTNCDFNVVPYLEVGQGGSAIAALSLETKSRSIFSQNLAFLELEKYSPGAFPMFSIGNYLELACVINNYCEGDYKHGLKKYNDTYNIITNASLYSTLLNRNFSDREGVYVN